MAPPPKRTVLITGCSDGGLGSGLAIAFHKHGHRVLAMARNPSKMANLHALGIETLTLDVLSDASIQSCLAQVTALLNPNTAEGSTTTGSGDTDLDDVGSGLDILINNAGGGYNMPFSDLDLSKAKSLFDLNVWSYVAVTQAFLPLLLRQASSRGTSMIVNNTSISSVAPTPFSSTYHASKAAAAMFSDHARIELAPFGVKVVDLKTGCVKSHFHTNRSDDSRLPAGSIYEPIREQAERAIRAEHFSERMDLEEWAELVVGDLLGRDGRGQPPKQVWRGTEAWSTWFWSAFGGHAWWDRAYARMVGLDVLERKIRG